MGATARFSNQAVKIRFARFGCANRPFYHIVAAKAYRKRDIEPLDRIGSYDPLPNDKNEKLVAINFEKLHYWMKRGAKPTKSVEILLGRFQVEPEKIYFVIFLNFKQKARFHCYHVYQQKAGKHIFLDLILLYLWFTFILQAILYGRGRSFSRLFCQFSNQL